MRKMTKKEQLLVEENYGLISSFLSLQHLEERDYYDTLAIALCHAAMTYREEKGTFDSYVNHCMKRAVQIEELHVQQQEDLVSCSSGIGSKLQSNACVEDSALFRQDFSASWKQLSEKTKKIVQMIVYGYKQAEIATAVGCTQSCVSRVRKRFLMQVDIL